MDQAHSPIWKQKKEWATNERNAEIASFANTSFIIIWCHPRCRRHTSINFLFLIIRALFLRNTTHSAGRWALVAACNGSFIFRPPRPRLLHLRFYFFIFSSAFLSFNIHHNPTGTNGTIKVLFVSRVDELRRCEKCATNEERSEPPRINSTPKIKQWINDFHFISFPIILIYIARSVYRPILHSNVAIHELSALAII